MKHSSQVEDEVVIEYLAAVIREAWRKADMVASLCARRDARVMKLPANAAALADGTSAPDRLSDFLLEFGSFLRIEYWRRSGLTAHLPVHLPSTSEAAERLRGLLNDGAGMESGESHLTTLQLETWLRHFSWSAPELVGVDVLLNGPPPLDGEFYDRLAAYLWKHRHADSEHPNEESGE